MEPQRKLLVVDDEPVVCMSCKRIFERQGFAVDTTNDSREGLKLAQKGEYEAILLDIKMPVMDGIEFLEELRTTNSDVPVLIITGYASIPTASAAMRLGAVDYIPKPFTPDEIVQAVARVVGPQVTRPGVRTTGRGAAEVTPARLEEFKPVGQVFAFVDEAWLQTGQDNSVRIGMFLLRSEAAAIQEIHLPRVGDVLHQGLPQVTFSKEDGLLRLIPSPVSGEVIEVNQTLKTAGKSPWDDPCHTGWIARVKPTERSEPIYPAESRKVLLLSQQSDQMAILRARFEHFGCRVRGCATIEEALQALSESPYPLAVVDAKSAGDTGPEMVRKLNDRFDMVKVLVLADPEVEREASYRAQKLFYYAVDPFADLEIVDILSAAFYRPTFPAPTKKLPVSRPQSLGRLKITSHDGTVVTLLADGDILKEGSGLGLQLMESSLGDRYPIEIKLGAHTIDPPFLAREAKESDKLFILKATDKNRIPGSLVINTHGHGLDWVKDHRAKVITLLEVQPLPGIGEPLSFDARTTQALAKHILHEMTV